MTNNRKFNPLLRKTFLEAFQEDLIYAQKAIDGYIQIYNGLVDKKQPLHKFLGVPKEDLALYRSDPLKFFDKLSKELRGEGAGISINPKERVDVYTDGSCKPNPGCGAWAAILVQGNTEIARFSGSEKHTTNNRMELTACWRGLLESQDFQTINVYSDSTYLCDPFKKGHIVKWKKKKFSNIKNADLWENIIDLTENKKVWFNWVRGHNGNHYNELCDKIAQLEAKKIKDKK